MIDTSLSFSIIVTGVKMRCDHSSRVPNGCTDVPNGLKPKPWVELINNLLISATALDRAVQGGATTEEEEEEVITLR